MKLRIVKVTKGNICFYIIQWKWLFFWITHKAGYIETDVHYESFEKAKQSFDYFAAKTKKEIVCKNY